MKYVLLVGLFVLFGFQVGAQSPTLQLRIDQVMSRQDFKKREYLL